MASQSQMRETPAYVSYTTFRNFIEELSEGPIPPRIDSSVMRTKSGSVQSQIRVAFRFLGLTDDDDHVTDRLRELVAAYGTDEWNDVWRERIEDAYAPIIGSVPMQNGTGDQLAEKFREIGGVSGSSLAKAVRFFLRAMDDAGMEYSDNFSPPKTRTRKRKKERRSKKSKKTKRQEVKDKGAKPNGGSPFEDAPDNYTPISFPLPGRPHPVTVHIPEDLSEIEWEMMDNYIRSFIERYQQVGKEG